MNINRRSIVLSQPKPASAAIPQGEQLKSVALLAFRFLRKSATQAQRLPGLAQQAGQVIVDAWHESALPKQ